VERRAFIATVTGGLLAAPLAVEAQQAMRVYRLGILGPGPRLPSDRMSLPNRVSTALHDLGYVEGRNLALLCSSSSG